MVDGQGNHGESYLTNEGDPTRSLLRFIHLDTLPDVEVMKVSREIAERILEHLSNGPLVVDDSIDEETRCATTVLYNTEKNITIEATLFVGTTDADGMLQDGFLDTRGMSLASLAEQVSCGRSFEANLKVLFFDGKHPPLDEWPSGSPSLNDTEYSMKPRGIFEGHFDLQKDGGNPPQFNALFGPDGGEDQFNLGTVGSMKIWIDGAEELHPTADSQD